MDPIYKSINLYYREEWTNQRTDMIYRFILRGGMGESMSG